MFWRIRHQYPQVGFTLKLIYNIGHVCFAGKDILKTFVCKSISDTKRLNLSYFFVVCEADEVVVEDVLAGSDEEGADVASAVLDDAHVDVVGHALAPFFHDACLLLAAHGDDHITTLRHR